jgi:hypothetical protein
MWLLMVAAVAAAALAKRRCRRSRRRWCRCFMAATCSARLLSPPPLLLPLLSSPLLNVAIVVGVGDNTVDTDFVAMAGIPVLVDAKLIEFKFNLFIHSN